jgi:hypothetical protein
VRPRLCANLVASTLEIPISVKFEANDRTGWGLLTLIGIVLNSFWCGQTATRTPKFGRFEAFN